MTGEAARVKGEAARVKGGAAWVKGGAAWAKGGKRLRETNLGLCVGCYMDLTVHKVSYMKFITQAIDKIS